MRALSTALLLLAALANLLPVVHDPNLAILMRHRAVLFAIVGGLLGLAVFHPPLRALASAAGLVSMLSFVAIAGLVGAYNPLLRRVLLVDVVASLCLIAAGVLDWLSVETG